MVHVKDIESDIEELGNLQILAQAYEEIASTRMKKARSGVLAKRDFIAEINSVFDEVKSAYATKIAEIAKKNKKRQSGKITFISHNGKNVAVFLSANTGLYGDIISKTFELFLEEVKTQGSEVTIVGRHGLSLFIQEMPEKPYTYFDLPDYNVNAIDMVKIIEHIVSYEEIHVYYGQFMNVINQKPSIYSISANIDLENAKIKNKRLYLFEPSLENILIFFEKEIFAALFEQTVNESELSKSASRMLAMDRASGNIQKYVEGLKIEKMKAHHKLINKKQLNALVSVL